jgi:hypothetical protein
VKQTPELDLIQAAMRPGAITQSGFLGSDARHLADILADDAAAVARLGLTHRALAARMRGFLKAGAEGLGDEIAVAPHFEVRVDGVRGSLPCPFGHAGLFAKTFCIVRNRTLDDTIAFTELQIHMIEAHGFYEGEGSPYRLPPERLARVLEIAAEE